MKFNIEIDCTPEEARRLFGLPDLEPLHDIYLSRVKELMAKGITPDMVQAMVKSWVPMGESGLNLVQSLLGQFGGGFMGAAPKSDAEESDKPPRGRKS
ncbi:MAG: transposase [Sphingopyxis macrogoltabida]|uniref:Transposase n=1 Tax=Sphingopyxis macrogoltabida TaxID=33050 RepID=A0A2W5LCA0_SPHMC|nr:MAG: transposase [Sphingopyxis macrogoltabida]